MKTQIIRTASIIRTAIVALVATAALHAQTTPMRFTIPFAFVAGNQTLPAGQYQVTQNIDGVVTLHETRAHANAIVLTNAVRAHGFVQDQGKLQFQQYGSTMVLYGIWTVGYDSGRAIPVARRYRELVARTKTPEGESGQGMKTVAIAAE